MPQGRIVELMGAAGAGKTTLLANLEARTGSSSNICTVSDLKSARNVIPYLRAFRSSALKSSIELENHAWLTAARILHRASRVRAALAILRRAARESRFIVADQGPAYTLVKLLELLRGGSKSSVEGAPPHWWLHLAAEVAETIDLVVWMDADESTLLERIRTRQKNHSVNSLPDRDALERLNKDRHDIELVLQTLDRVRGLRIVRWEPSLGGRDDCVEMVMSALSELPEHKGLMDSGRTVTRDAAASEAAAI